MDPIKYQVRCKLSDKDSGLLENADHGSHIVLVLVITQYLIHMSNQVSSGGIRVKKIELISCVKLSCLAETNHEPASESF